MDGERGASPVAGKRQPIISKKQAVWGVAGVTAALVALFVWRGSNSAPKPVKEKLPQRLGSTVSYDAPKMVIPEKEKPAPVQHEPPAKPAAAAPEQHLQMPQTSPFARITPRIVQKAAAPDPEPNMVSYSYSAKSFDGQHGAAGGSDAEKPSGGEPARRSDVVYAEPKLEGQAAGRLGDQTFLLMPGVMPCILDTAIDSTLEGPIECHIPMDIRPHGVTLLDRGSIVHGTYKNNLRNGQARIFVQADYVEDRATGCFINLDSSPIGDGVGRAGVAGDMDNHVFERFGAAVILSLVNSGMSLGQAALSNGGNTYLSFSSGSGVDNLASQILRKQIDIPPTITVNQGTQISVLVRKPLDFSACYSLKVRN
jgi:type IV secretion system protein VirB10